MAQEKVFFDIQMNGADKTIKQLQTIENELKKLSKTKEKDKNVEVMLRAEKKRLNAEINKSVRQFNAEKNAVKAAAGSYDQLVEENKSLVIQMKRLSPNTKENRKEISRLSKSIRNNTDKLKKMDSAMGRSFRNVGNYRSAISGLASAFLPAVGVGGLAMAVKGAINIIKDFEQSMAKVRAISGATEEDFNRLSESAKKLGGSTMFTASEVAKLQLEFSKLGFTTNDILAATEATLDLAIATGSDLAEAAVVAASTIRGFGLSTTETKRVTDVMAKSFTSSALDLSKFSTAMASVAPVAKNAGVGIEETTAIIAKVADAGVDASTAGTSLRNIFLELSKKGMTFDHALKIINTSTDKNAAALELFGKRGATTATIIASNIEEIDKLTESLNNSTGAAKEMADIVGDTLQGKLLIFQSTIEGIVLNDGSKFNNFLKDAVEFGTDLATGIGGLADSFDILINGMDGASESSRKFILEFGELRDGVFDFEGKKVKEILQPLADLSSDEFFKKLPENRKRFISLFQAQNQELSDIIPLWNTYLKVRTKQSRAENESSKAAEQEAEKRKLAADAAEKLNEKIEKLKGSYNGLEQAIVQALMPMEVTDTGIMGTTLDAVSQQIAESQDEIALQTLLKEKDLEDKVNDQKIKLAQQAQQEIFNIVSNNIDRRTEKELDALQKQKDQNLISESEFEKRSTSIKREAFNQQKKLDIAQALINGAVAISKTIAQLGGVGLITPAGQALIALTAAQTAVQVGAIAAQKFAKGGLVGGGVFEGNSHAQGGVKFSSGGRIMEAEGGEAIINKRSTSMYKPLLSAINQAGGGKKFAFGGITPDAQLQTNTISESGLGAEIARQMGEIRVINVVSDTTSKQISINNVESEALF